MPPLLSLVVACGLRNEIGKDGRMPWHLPADLQHFRAVTLGKPVIMGRRTFAVIGRPLPQRRNIVVTRNQEWRVAGCEPANSLDAALSLAADASEVIIIGGGDIYRQALPRVQRIYLTRVHANFDADTFFPSLEPLQWRELGREDRPADARNPFKCSFILLQRMLA